MGINLCASGASVVDLYVFLFGLFPLTPIPPIPHIKWVFARLFHRQFPRTAVPFYLAILLLVVSLFIFFASGWLLYSLFRDAKEDEIDQRLADIAHVAEPMVAERAEFVLKALKDDDRLPASNTEWQRWFDDLRAVFSDKFDQLAAELKGLSSRASLSGATLFTLQQRVIADASGKLRPGDTDPLLAVDRLAWQAALKGNSEEVPYYEYQGIPQKRVYIPLRVPNAPQNEVGAVLRVEASFEASRLLNHLRTQGLILAAIVTALMGTVALMFRRLFRLFARVQDTAAHRDRLQAMGTLAAGIAHEIRNPLGIIRTMAEALSGDLKPDAPEKDMLGDIISEVERLNKLVNQYLQFARPEAVGPDDFSHPDQVIRSLALLFDKSDSDSPAIDIDMPASLPAVKINETSLRQVLLNLMINARDASPSDGKPIAIRCLPRRVGAQIEIVITDHGCGIPPRDQRRVFDPFYTTKANGSGLGLPICRHLVTEAGGSLDLESKAGQGTTVRIILPAGK